MLISSKVFYVFDFPFFFNFPEEIFSRIGCKIAKKVQERHRESEQQGKGNDSCHFSDQNFLPCYLCKYLNILFQNKNEIFQLKNLPITLGNLVEIG